MGKNLSVTPARYKSEFPWLKEVDSLALCNAQLHLQTAYKNFFRDASVGFPKFKSKKKPVRSYTTNCVNGNIILQNGRLKLPKAGWIRIRQHRKIEEGYQLKGATITQEADERYYVALLYSCEEPVNEIRKAVNKIDPTICIYGEGWAAEAPQYPADSLAMKGNVARMPDIAVFSDELRDGLCGPVWEKDKGAFLAGVPGGEASVKFGIVGAIEHPQVRCDSVNYSRQPWAKQPTQMISYVSCHDGLCLVDRIKASMPGITPEQLVRLDKLAQTVVFTSQGIPFIYAGEEVMRDKKGVDNSYKSPDAVNAIDWRRKTTNEDVFTYYKRLIDLRKSHPAFRMGDAEMVRRHLEFLPVEGNNLIAFLLKEHANGDRWEDIIVAFNSRTTPARLEVPAGKYTVVCKDGVIDVRGLGTQTGPEVIVPGQSALIMYK